MTPDIGLKLLRNEMMVTGDGMISPAVFCTEYCGFD